MTELRALARLMWRHRMSSAAALVMLAVAITGATTTFALIDAVQWRQLPYRDSTRLVGLVTTHVNGNANVSLPDFVTIRERISGVGLSAAGGFTPEYALTGFGEPRQVRGRVLAGEYFQTLGVPLAAGRDFTRDEEKAGAGNVAIITHHVWQQLFGDRDALGAVLALNGRIYTIVGVLPPYRDPFGNVDVYVPHQFSPTLPRRFRMLIPILRLGPGIDLRSIRSQLRVITATADAEAAGYRVDAMPLAEHVGASTRSSAKLLFGAAAALLGIGLLNFATFMVARARHRESEFALRSALGAGRLRILLLAAMDAAALSICGTVVALAASRVLLPVLRGQYGSDVVNAVGMDLRVVTFALGVAAVAILTAVLATWRAFRGRPVFDRRIAVSRLAAGRMLVVGQIAVSMALVVSSAVLVRGFLALRHVDPGFRTSDIHAARVALPAGRYNIAQSRAQFWRTLLDRLGAQHVRVAITTELPLSGDDNPTSFSARLTNGAAVTTKIRSVSPEYFDVMGIPLRQGRPLSRTDDADGPRVVLVNERLASHLSEIGPPIGQSISFDVAATPIVAQVVGVVADIRHERLGGAPTPEAYGPFEQSPLATYSLVMRTDRGLADTSEMLRRELATIDRGQPFTGPVPISDYVERSLAGSRFQAEVLSFFAVTALVVAAAGLYGLLVYLLAGSRREWAVRLALGATARDLQRTLLAQTARYTALGTVLGFALFAMASRAVDTLVYGISVWSPVVILGSAAAMVAVCFVSATIPVWRAGQISAAEALGES